jgi:hypothetical protein
MLKVTVLFEAHDPAAQARIAELEAERDAAERDATPSPLLSAMADIAKTGLLQAMADPEKFKEFLKLFQKPPCKPFDISSIIPSHTKIKDSKIGDVVTSDPPPAEPFLKVADSWTNLEPNNTVFVRRSWPDPTSIIARVQRVGGAIPIEMGAELHVWSLENEPGKSGNLGGAAKTAAAAAMAVDKVLHEAGWILLGDYDYDTFPNAFRDLSKASDIHDIHDIHDDEDGDEGEDNLPPVQAKPAKSPRKPRA